MSKTGILLFYKHLVVRNLSKTSERITLGKEDYIDSDFKRMTRSQMAFVMTKNIQTNTSHIHTN